MKIVKKMLMAGMAAFMLGALMSCGGSSSDDVTGGDWAPEGALNLLEDGNADGNSADDIGIEPAKLEPGQGLSFDPEEGGVTGDCYLAKQTGGAWSGELQVDLTAYYGKGKNYLISAKVKNNPTFTNPGDTFHFSYVCYSGAVDAFAALTGDEYYDYDDEAGTAAGIVSPWGGELKNDEFDEFNFPIKLSETKDVMLNNKWQTLYFAVPSSEIERMIDGTGLRSLSISFYMGTSAERGYSYLIDDIYVWDLNPEIPFEGQTYAEAEMYEVSFVDEEGSEICEPVKVIENETATAPEDPEMEGYTFIGWFAPEATEPFDFENTPITEDLELTAKFEATQSGEDPQDPPAGGEDPQDPPAGGEDPQDPPATGDGE